MGNVAQELYIILTDIKESQDTNTYKALGKVFNIPQQDTDDIVLAYGMIFGMINEIKANLETLQYIPKEKYLEALSNASKALTRISFDMTPSINAYQSSIDGVTLARIDACGDLFSQVTGEFEIDTEKLNQLLKEVSDLIESVEKSSVDSSLKSTILVSLGDIKKSIINYRFKGTRGIKNALDSSVGAMILNTTVIDTEEEKSIFEKVFDLISKFNQLVLFGRNVGTIAPPLIKLFLDNK